MVRLADFLNSSCEFYIIVFYLFLCFKITVIDLYLCYVLVSATSFTIIIFNLKSRYCSLRNMYLSFCLYIVWLSIYCKFDCVLVWLFLSSFVNYFAAMDSLSLSSYRLRWGWPWLEIWIQLRRWKMRIQTMIATIICLNIKKKVLEVFCWANTFALNFVQETAELDFLIRRNLISCSEKCLCATTCRFIFKFFCLHSFFFLKINIPKSMALFFALSYLQAFLFPFFVEIFSKYPIHFKVFNISVLYW